jgi:DNA polymerase-3 subunit alpha
MGLTKYDFLVTEIQDKILQCILLLQQDGQIDPNLTIKQVYEKYLATEVIDIEDDKIWDAIDNNEILNLFQFDSEVGSQAAKKIRPRSMRQLADSNGLMRLAPSEKGAEPPMEKYIRFKGNIQLWYDEMRRYGLTSKEVEAVKPYFEQSFGVPPSQEQLMLMLMDKNICNFSLGEANTARKIVAKKQIKRIPELMAQVHTRAASANLGRYIWDCGVKPQATYSFSIIHALAYSFVGYQTAFLATHWNPIYWNTACLIINSSSADEDDNNDDDDEDDETLIGAKKKKKTANYEKIAKALGMIIGEGIKVSTVDINKSDLTFKPDAKNNQILYGLRPVTQVNDEQIEQIIAGRPYVSFFDFLHRCPLKKPTMISLIKGGAFDALETEWAAELNIDPRILIMAIYISIISEPKTKLNLQNFNGLIQKDLIPPALDIYKKIFSFNKYLKASCKAGSYLVFNTDASLNFYNANFDADALEVIAGVPCIKEKLWSKFYTKAMDGARDWLKENQEQILREFNTTLFLEMWDKYAYGTISFWEMSSLCFYSHEHELAHVDFDRYGISNFFDMPTKPEVDYYYKKKGKKLPVYKINRIAGTVIGKNDARASIALLTVDGVVNVKFTKEYYAMFKKQISEKDQTGTKHVKEKSWFKRGTKLMIQGYRKDDTFVSKTYYNTPGHQLYKILSVNGNEITLTSERYQVEDENV